MPLIPINSILTDKQYEALPRVIERRKKELRRSQGTEMDLWLMEELAHLKDMLKHNQTIRKP